jgi:hypothetical protein
MAIIFVAIIEFLMFGVGVWALYYNVLPERWFDMVFGAGDYRTSPQAARLFGIVLVLPFVFFIGRLVFGLRLFTIWFDEYLHVGVLCVMLIVAMLWARHIRKTNKAKKVMRPPVDSDWVDDL